MLRHKQRLTALQKAFASVGQVELSKLILPHRFPGGSGKYFGNKEAEHVPGAGAEATAKRLIIPGGHENRAGPKQQVQLGTAHGKDTRQALIQQADANQSQEE